MITRLILKLFTGLCTVLFMASCGSDSAGEGPTLSVSPNMITLDDNGNGTLTVSSNTQWMVRSADSWLNCSPGSGSGGSIVTLSASVNNSGAYRSTSLTFIDKSNTKSVSVSVTQRASGNQTPDPILTVSPSNLNFSSSGGNNTFNIKSNGSWSVSVPTGDNWCTVSPSSGLNDGVVTVNTSANPNSNSRSTTITVTSGTITQTVSVSQEATSTQEMVLKDFLEKPFGIVDVNLKTDPYETIKAKLSSLYTFYSSSDDPTNSNSLSIYASENINLKNMSYCGFPFYGLYVSDTYVAYSFESYKTDISDPYTSLDQVVNDFKNMGVSMSYEKKNENYTKAEGGIQVGDIYYYIELMDYNTLWQIYISMYISSKSNNVANCTIVPKNFLAYTDGFVTEWTVDTNVSKGYFKAYKKSDMTSMTDAQIISDLSTTSSIPGSELKSYIYYRGPSYSSNTDYVLCSVAYNNNNQQGELQKYEFSTRSSTLPMAEMSSLTSGSSGGKDYWYFTITAKNSATSYYLGYFTDEEDYDLNFWYLPYWLYYKVQDGSYTSADAYDLWGNVQFGRSTSQVSLATWAIVSGKTLGNTSFIQGTTRSSARGVPYKANNSKKEKFGQLSRKKAEELSKNFKLFLVNGY